MGSQQAGGKCVGGENWVLVLASPPACRAALDKFLPFSRTELSPEEH